MLFVFLTTELSHVFLFYTPDQLHSSLGVGTSLVPILPLPILNNKSRVLCDSSFSIFEQYSVTHRCMVLPLIKNKRCNNSFASFYEVDTPFNCIAISTYLVSSKFIFRLKVIKLNCLFWDIPYAQEKEAWVNFYVVTS